MARKSIKSKAGLGAAGFVIAAAVFGTIMASAKAGETVVDLAASTVIPGAERAGKAAPASLAWSIPQVDMSADLEARDPHLLGKEARRHLAWLALGGIISAAIGLFGANRLLQMLAGLGRGMARAGAVAARAPVKAAKVAAKATKKAMKSPGRWLLTVAGLTVFALTGVAFLDIQWEAGMLAGAGIATATVWGWNKTGAMLSRLSPFGRRAESAG